MRKLLTIFILGLSPFALQAQKSDLTALFQEQKPLDTKLSVSIKGIKKKTNDSTYLDTFLWIKGNNGQWDSVKTEIRARGIFRRANCYFAPIKIKIKKSEAKGTILEGNKNLKLVLPCANNERGNDLIVKEFICYKIYEQITPYYFNTRLTQIDFTEAEGKKSKKFQLKGIWIEDDNLVAIRHHAKVMESMNLNPLALNDTSALFHDIFQFLIGNTDWSTSFQHNSKLIFQAPKKYIPLTYDFDMSGLVNPPYAVVNEQLGIDNVRQRLYRGVCRPEGATQWVRNQFIQNESRIMKVIDDYQKDLPEKEYADVKKYVGEFFIIIKDDKTFQDNISGSVENETWISIQQNRLVFTRLPKRS